MSDSESAPAPPDNEALNAEHWEKKANWKLGLFYYAPADPRAWVPKRSSLGRRRMGVTPNLANPVAQRYLLLVTAGFGVIILLVWLLETVGVLR